MFESVTKRRKNPVINFFGWSLLFVVCIVFIFIGFSPNSSFLGQGGAAAEVNGDAISLRDFKELVDRLSDSQKAQGRDERRKLQENALDILVSRTLIVQEAKKLNVFVSDKEVGKTLLDIEAFYEEGNFSRLRYKTYLRQVRLTESEFEDRIRRDLIIQKMSRLIGFAGKDVELVDNFDNQIDKAKVNIAYVSLTPGQLSQAQGDQNVESYISENKEDVENYYKTHSSEFATPEQVKARHILIKSKDEKPESFEVALKKAEKIAKLLTIENFSNQAKKHSEDPGSKTKGGDLGYFGRGRMVPEFEKTAFSLAKEKISQPVKSKFGYHIILVDDKKEATEKPLKEVEASIAKKLIAKSKFESVTKEIKAMLSGKKYGELETLLSRYDLRWKSTGYFSITKENIPGIGQHKEFFDVAMTIGQDNEYANNLVYKGDTIYLLKYKGAKMEKSSTPSQMDFFKQLMKQQRMNGLVQSWANSLKKQASISENKDLIR